MYGLSELRYGDNVDLLTQVYYQGSMAFPLLLSGNPEAAAVGLRLLGLANVKYLIDYPDVRPPGGALRLHYKGPDVSIWENGFFKPRAGFYDRYVHLPLERLPDWNRRAEVIEPIVQTLRRGFDWDRTLILHDLPAAAPSPVPAKASVRVDDYRPDLVRLTVETDRAGLVFLSDSRYPGWEAFVNSAARPILRSWLAFRAVEVPAGRVVAHGDRKAKHIDESRLERVLPRPYARSVAAAAVREHQKPARMGLRIGKAAARRSKAC